MHQTTQLKSEIDDIEGIYMNAKRVLINDSLRKTLIHNGFQTVKKYDWKNIAYKYYKQLYKDL